MQSGQAVYELVEQLQKVDESAGNTDSYQQLQQELAIHINDLINENFSLLISILYRLDISEQKIKMFLRQSNNSTAADIISGLIIERQLQKMASKKASRNTQSDISDDERW